MTGVETAVVAAGRAVAERAVREWLAVRSSRTERESDLSELIRANFRDRMAPRKFANQVNGIALAVEDRLRPLVEHEYGGLDEDARAAVLAEVTDALRRADFSDAALFEADGDPGALAERVLRRLPPPRLGEAEDRLYAALLAESVECVVRMVRQLPQYLPRAASETLSRLSGLSGQMERVLARMPIRTLDAPEGRQDDAAFERRYLDHLSRVLDEVELIGVRVDNFRPVTSLSAAYISLSVTGANPRERPGRLPIASLAEPPEEAGGLRVESALGRSRLTLLRGEAGSGKSTLLRWLAVRAARGGFTGDLQAWHGCVPFLIKLRSHADGRFPPPGRFPHDVAPEVAGLMPRGWVERVLAAGRGLLLVDGVDELVVEHRPAVRHWLAGLLAAYPGMRVVVTSRPTAAEAEWLAHEGFTAALLEPMTPADLAELVRQWHAAVRECPSLPCEPEELEGYQGALLSRLESAPHLRQLATTPLLAAMLCALNLDRRSRLPRSRMGLYEAVLEMLLERRDAERRIPDTVALDREQKVWILRDLAWLLVSTGRSELPKATALKRVAQKLESMTRVSYPPQDVLAHLLRRSGVLREPVPERIDFVHKTIQEYLAAGQIVEDEDVDLVVRNAHFDDWREVAVMTAGHATGRLRRALLAGLLERAGREAARARSLRLLVVSCLETIQEIPADLRDRIEECFRLVIPPVTETEAALLAAAGEETLRRLPDDLSGLRPEHAAMTVRTAWLINGPAALAKLAAHAADGRPNVTSELIASSAFFDTEEYARRVLSRIPRGVSLRVRRFGQLRSLRHLENLTALTVDEEVTVGDLAFLRDLPRLRSLEVLALDTEHVREIGELSELRYLRIGKPRPGPVDCSGLAGLHRLQNLRLNLSVRHDDLSFLDLVPRLTSLGLTLPDGADLGPLARQSELRELRLHGAPQRADLSSMAGMTLLTDLTLSSVTPVGGVSAIADTWPGVMTLTLGGLADLTALTGIGKLWLTELYIARCPRIGHLEDLRGLPHLTRVTLRSIPAADLAPLADLPRLSALVLYDLPGPVDLAPLAGIRELDLYLGGGQQVINEDLLGDSVTVLRM